MSLISKNNAFQIMLIFFNLTLISAKKGGGRGGRRSSKSGGIGFRYSPGAIAGTVVACVVFVALFIIGLLWQRRRRLAKEQEEKVKDLEDQMPYAQRVAMEDALVLKSELEAAKKKEKKGIFRW